MAHGTLRRLPGSCSISRSNEGKGVTVRQQIGGSSQLVSRRSAAEGTVNGLQAGRLCKPGRRQSGVAAPMDPRKAKPLSSGQSPPAQIAHQGPQLMAPRLLANRSGGFNTLAIADQGVTGGRRLIGQPSEAVPPAAEPKVRAGASRSQTRG